MACKAYILITENSSLNISRETILYTSKKFLSVFFVHIVAFVPLLLAKLFFLENDSVFLSAIKALPGLFFLTKTGVAEFEIIEAEWYISKMLLSGMILFPLLLRLRKIFSRIICPILGIFLIGYLIKNDGMLGNVDKWVFSETVPKVFVRAFAEMSLGIFLYEIVDYLKKCNLISRLRKIIYTVLEFLLYATAIYFMMLPSGEYEVYFLAFVFTALIISFSGVSWTDRLFENRFCIWLGRLSLPIYLCQGLAFGIIKYTSLSQLPPYVRLATVIMCVFAVSVPVMALSDWMKRKALMRLNKILLPEDAAMLG